ncbi:MAG: phosphoribosyl-ATP diphosphatase [Proteobacteria bacterium]|nr:phosphoribosyl-ATP diphosphatase [Pseudomonadota bacterium]
MTDGIDEKILKRLFATIESRKGGDPESSYTAKLLAAGTPKIAKKLAEEAAETMIAAIAEGPDALRRESADLLYHLLVLWSAAGVTPDEVYAELAKREGISGIAEKQNRSQDS